MSKPYLNSYKSKNKKEYDANLEVNIILQSGVTANTFALSY
jgi:hypothetical protein